MKNKTLRINAKTKTSAKNTVRKYGRIPTKVTLLKKNNMPYGMNLYTVHYHLKK